jgi:transcriptional regulator with XRE-family HTH domain
MKKTNTDQDTRITEISQFIRNWRVNDQISQNDLASIAEIHANTVYNLETGKNVTLRTLLNCTDALGITLSDLFDGIE